LTTDGEAWCWGGNSAGQVGNGDTLSTPLNVFAPARVATDVRFTRLAVGGQFTCGLTADGVVWCWGRNQGGVLGSETQRHTSTPVRVR
jgi:alpha-tubulin suppressor-like RCC1 family protein